MRQQGEATSIRRNIRLSYLEIINFTQQVAVKKIAAKVCGSAKLPQTYRKLADLQLRNTSGSFVEFAVTELSLNPCNFFKNLKFINFDQSRLIFW